MEERELSKSTIRTYLYAVREFGEKYGELSKKNLIDYKKYLIENRKPKTAGIRCIAVNQYCIFMGRQELCVKAIRIQKATSMENVISREQYENLLSALKDDGRMRWYYIILFLGRTGARVSELIQFKKSDLERGYCEIWTKGKIRRIRFPQSLVNESAGYFQTVEGDWLFTNRYGDPITREGVRTVMQTMAELYGIDRKVMHPHSLRHMFAIEFLKNNKNIALLADLMGHENVDTTAVYLKLSEKEQAEQLNRAVDW